MKRIIVLVLSLFMMLSSSMLVLADETETMNNETTTENAESEKDTAQPEAQSTGNLQNELSEVKLFAGGVELPIFKNEDLNNPIVGAYVWYEPAFDHFNDEQRDVYRRALESGDYYYTYKMNGEEFTVRDSFKLCRIRYNLCNGYEFKSNGVNYAFLIENNGGALLSQNIEKAYVELDGVAINFVKSSSYSTSSRVVYVAQKKFDVSKLTGYKHINFKLAEYDTEFHYGSLDNKGEFDGKDYTGLKCSYLDSNGSVIEYIFAVEVRNKPVNNPKLYIDGIEVDMQSHIDFVDGKVCKIYNLDYEKDNKDAQIARELYLRDNKDFYISYYDANGIYVTVDFDKFVMSNMQGMHGYVYELKAEDGVNYFVPFSLGHSLSDIGFKSIYAVVNGDKYDLVKSDNLSTKEHPVYLIDELNDGEVNLSDINYFMVEYANGNVVKLRMGSQFEEGDVYYWGERVYYTENGNPDNYFIVAKSYFKNNIFDVKFQAGEMVMNAILNVYRGSTKVKAVWHLDWDNLSEEQKDNWFDYYYNQDIDHGYKVSYTDENGNPKEIELSPVPANVFHAHGIVDEVNIDGIEHVFFVVPDGDAFRKEEIKIASVNFRNNVYEFEPLLSNNDLEVYMIKGDMSDPDFYNEAEVVIELKEDNYTVRLPLNNYHNFGDSSYRGCVYFDAGSSNPNRMVVYATEAIVNTLADMTISIGDKSASLISRTDYDYGIPYYVWEIDYENPDNQEAVELIEKSGTGECTLLFRDGNGENHSVSNPFQRGNSNGLKGDFYEFEVDGVKHIVFAKIAGPLIDLNRIDKASISIGNQKYEYKYSKELSNDECTVYLIDEQADVSKISYYNAVEVMFKDGGITGTGCGNVVQTTDGTVFCGGLFYANDSVNTEHKVLFVHKYVKNSIKNMTLNFGDYSLPMELMPNSDGFVWVVNWPDSEAFWEFMGSESYYLSYTDLSGKQVRIDGPFESDNRYGMHSYAKEIVVDGYKHYLAISFDISIERDDFVKAYTSINGKGYGYKYSEKYSNSEREVYLLDSSADLSNDVEDRLIYLEMKNEVLDYPADAMCEFKEDGIRFTGLYAYYTEGKNADKMIIFADRVDTMPVIDKEPVLREGLVFNGEAQELVVKGEAKNCEFRYALGASADDMPELSEYTVNVPKRTDAGTYYVFVAVYEGDKLYSNDYIGKVEIAKAEAVFEAPKLNADTVYDGKAHAVLTEGSSDNGKFIYAAAIAGTNGLMYSDEVPTVTNAGKYDVYYIFKGDVNHNDSKPVKLGTFTVAKAQLKLELSKLEVKSDVKVLSINIGELVNATGVNNENINGDVVLRLVNENIKVEDLESFVLPVEFQPSKEYSNNYAVTQGNIELTVKLSINNTSVKLEPMKVESTDNAEAGNKAKLEITNDVSKSTLINLVKNSLDATNESVLEKEVKEAVENNRKVSAKLETTPVKKDDTSVELQKKAGDKAEFFDISIYLVVNDTKKDDVKISETADDVKIAIELPELPDVKDGYQREYVVLREHDGKVERINCTYVNGKLEFSSNLFSTYAWYYQDVKLSTGGGSSVPSSRPVVNTAAK